MPPKTMTFEPTQWSAIRLAVAQGRAGSQEALARFCEAYWHPIYAFIRHSGWSPHAAEDLTQGFFKRLLEDNILARADPEKGRLRAFLLTCVKRHLSDEHDLTKARKRGGGQVVNIDPKWAEEHYAAERVDDMTPDRLYQRRWAITLLKTTLDTLAAEHHLEGKSALFEALRPFLGFTTKGGQDNYEEVAKRLGVNSNTLKSHVRRLRESWRLLLLSEVARTLDDPTPENIREELAELTGCV